MFNDSWSKLKDLNPVAAGIIMAAFVAFLAVILVSVFADNVESRIPLVAYFLVIGTAIYVVSAIVNDRILNTIIRWFVILLLLCWCLVFTAGRIYPANEPLACLSYFWRSCRTVVDEIGAAQASRPGVKLTVPGTPALPRTADQTPAAGDQTPVFLQFAGAYDRDDIRTGMRILAGKGWNMQGVAGGGQRTRSAVGVNEIRFRDPRRQQAAERLAADVTAAGLSNRRLTISRTDAVVDDRLEIWISN
jgi:hypothetical protein